MKLLMCLFIYVSAKSLLEQLEKENRELKKAYTDLQKQVYEISQLNDYSSQILDDYMYNKDNLDSLINEYRAEEDSSIRIALAQDMIEFIQGLIEDSRLYGGKIDDISTKELIESRDLLKKATDLAKESERSREFQKVYEELNDTLIKREEIVAKIQFENARLNSDLKVALSELQEVSKKYNNEHYKLQELQKEIEVLKRDHAERLGSLTESLKSEQQTSRKKELKDFQKIQESQDELILKLQDRIADQSLMIEQLSVEKSSLISRVRLLENTNDRLQDELVSRSTQLEASHQKFEDFRREIENETNNEILSIEGTEGHYRTELKSLDKKQIKLLEEITSCVRERDILTTNNRQKENRIRDLEKDLLDFQDREFQVKIGRDKETELEKTKLSDLESHNTQLSDDLDSVKSNVKANYDTELYIKQKLKEVSNDEPEIRVRSRYDYEN